MEQSQHEYLFPDDVTEDSDDGHPRAVAHHQGRRLESHGLLHMEDSNDGMGLGGGGLALLPDDSMSAFPDGIFKLRRTKMRLAQAEEAIQKYAEQSALDAHYTATAGVYELLSALYRILGKEAACLKCEEKRDFYVRQAERLSEKRKLPQRRKNRPKRAEAQSEQNASPYKNRDTPVEQQKVIRGDKPKNR